MTAGDETRLLELRRRRAFLDSPQAASAGARLHARVKRRPAGFAIVAHPPRFVRANSPSRAPLRQLPILSCARRRRARHGLCKQRLLSALPFAAVFFSVIVIDGVLRVEAAATTQKKERKKNLARILERSRARVSHFRDSREAPQLQTRHCRRQGALTRALAASSRFVTPIARA